MISKLCKFALLFIPACLAAQPSVPFVGFTSGERDPGFCTPGSTPLHYNTMQSKLKRCVAQDTWMGVVDETRANQPGGYPVLGSDGKVPAAQLPAAQLPVCSGVVTTNCLPSAGPDGSVAIGDTVLNPTTGIQTPAITVGDGTTAGEWPMCQPTANGTNCVSHKAPDALTSTYRMEEPASPPGAGGKILVFQAPDPITGISTSAFSDPVTPTPVPTMLDYYFGSSSTVNFPGVGTFYQSGAVNWSWRADAGTNINGQDYLFYSSVGGTIAGADLTWNAPANASVGDTNTMTFGLYDQTEASLLFAWPALAPTSANCSAPIAYFCHVTTSPSATLTAGHVYALRVVIAGAWASSIPNASRMHVALKVTGVN